MYNFLLRNTHNCHWSGLIQTVILVIERMQNCWEMITIIGCISTVCFNKFLGNQKSAFILFRESSWNLEVGGWFLTLKILLCVCDNLSLMYLEILYMVLNFCSIVSSHFWREVVCLLLIDLLVHKINFYNLKSIHVVSLKHFCS